MASFVLSLRLALGLRRAFTDADEGGKMNDKMRDIVANWIEAIVAAGDTLLRHAVVEIPADSAGWIDSGVDIKIGDTATLLSIGDVRVSEDPDISFASHLFLWRRIGTSGAIAKFAAPTTTFEANESGRLMLVAQYPGAWLDETGGFAPDWPRSAASGVLSVAILVRKGPAPEGLAIFAASDKSGLSSTERNRFLAPVRPPRGWTHLWRTGETEIYREQFEATDAPRITCRCSADAGILKYPVDIALDETTHLAWRWRMIQLPSRIGEDSGPTHDYLSIAVEFENGLDLTYMWSAALPVGNAFRCPLPWWDKRETHQVVRSGESELGRWWQEEQPVLADYKKAIGGVPPARIVGVWLIAVAAFQRGRGECDYEKIELRSGGGSIMIGP
jgi:hypothetical protein